MRRLHRWFGLWPSLFHLVSELKRKISLSFLYFIDSFPVSFCDNIRIKRSKLAKGERYRGYIASKRVYFYGLRVHIVRNEERFIDDRTYAVGRKGAPHMASDRPKRPIYGGGNDSVGPQLRNS
jgi:spore coat polysaccharide biosynthesis predicted glycosyltransferase SpsG